MPSESAPGPVWRPEPSSAARRVASTPLWRRETAEGRPVARRAELAIATVLLLGFATMLVWASTWLSPLRPSAVVLIGAGYFENLNFAQQSCGWRSLEDFAELATTSKEFSFWGGPMLELVHRPVSLQRETEWGKALDGLSQPNVVLYMSLHGAADSQGAYLLCDDADVEPSAADRLRVKEVIGRLARLPEETNKLLILDAVHFSANWQLGVLQNDFARRLKQLEPTIRKVPNLVVLCASDVEQISWDSPSWRQTVFGHYLVEGLRGGATDWSGDGRLDAWDVYHYLHRSVSRWVAANRNAHQTPLLLPRGDEGRRRAERIELVPVQRGYRAADPHGLPVFSPPEELVAAWKEHQRLSQQVPAPYAYTPHLWRRYEDCLIRYEQLLEAGEASATRRLRHRLEQLRRRIDQARELELSTTQSGLAMLAAAGVDASFDDDEAAGSGPWVSHRAMQVLDQLWSAQPAQRSKLWEKVAGEHAEPADRQLLRLQLYELLLKRAADDPAENLATCYETLQVIDDPLHPWPAEIHCLVMLQRDLAHGNPSGQLCDLIQLALRVRSLAEQAALGARPGSHPYSEQVRGWIAAQVDQADAIRRKGEDLLLGGSSNFGEARRSLGKAEAIYEEAHRLACTIGQAVEVRNRLLSRLPYYARWAACRQSGLAVRHHADCLSIEAIEELCRQVHDLSAELQPPGQQPQGRPVTLRSLRVRVARLKACAGQLAQSFASMEQAARESWKSLSDVDSPRGWYEAETALLVPTGDPSLRMRLLVAKHRTARRLLTETSHGERIAPRPAVAARASLGTGRKRAATGYRGDPGRMRKSRTQRMLPEDRETLAVQRAARAQGRMATAVLGKRWFDEAPCEKDESLDQILHRLEVFAVEQRWWDSLNRAGESIGRRWQCIAQAIGSRLSEATKAAGSTRRDLLFSADQLARLLDGAAELKLQDPPSYFYRRQLLGELLIWQARRTLEDHWFAEDPSDKPYYQVLGLAYLADAENLGAETKEVELLREKLNRPGTLTLATVDALELTTQPRFAVTATLKPTEGAYVPAGMPAVWIEPGKSVELIEPDEASRQVRSLDAKGNSDSVQYVLRSPLLQQCETKMPDGPKVDSTEVVLCGLYRGQRIRVSVPVHLHLAADRLLGRFPEPEKASLAVRAPLELQRRFGEGNGAVAVVLDCTGSMGPEKGQPYDDKTKFAEATHALERVLGRLPKGTTLSLWVFGQAEGKQKTVAEPEHTIRRVLDPVRWDPDDASQLADLMSRVRHPALEPWNESPIVHAIMAAKADLENAAGYKTILVLTDGIDNRFAHDPQLNPRGQSIPDFLTSAMAHSGIELNIIGFRMSDEDQAKAWKQFEVVGHLFPPGHFVPVSESQTLAAALRAGLKQHLRYWVAHYDNRLLERMPADGLTVGDAQGNDQWLPGGVEPGFYKVRMQAGRRIEKGVGLEGGDLLLLRLVDTPHGPALCRDCYGEADFQWKPFAVKSGWRATLLQNQRVDRTGLQMLLALEKQPSADETILEQIRPRQAWIEVEPQDSAGASMVVRWHEQTGYPAPAFSIDIPDWPTLSGTTSARQPRLRVWWNPEQPIAAQAVLQRHHDFESLAELSERTVRAGQDRVQIRYVGIEKHLVQVAPGVHQERSCLAVRITHEPEASYWVRISGLHAAGSEHRFYTEIGHYTGLFWPINHDEAHRDLNSLELVGLDRFKAEARQRGYYVELDKLAAPEPSDYRPAPPLGDKSVDR